MYTRDSKLLDICIYIYMQFSCAAVESCADARLAHKFLNSHANGCAGVNARKAENAAPAH